MRRVLTCNIALISLECEESKVGACTRLGPACDALLEAHAVEGGRRSCGWGAPQSAAVPEVAVLHDRPHTASMHRTGAMGLLPPPGKLHSSL